MSGLSVQAPRAVVLIRPHCFRPNPHTRDDNGFQAHDQRRTPEQVAAAAYAEATRLAEALTEAGVREGLGTEVARALALETVYGAGRLARETGEHPAILRERVTSPGGTTSAGLAALESGGFRAALLAAVRAATQRSRELGKP